MANCYFAKPDGMQHCYIPFLYVIDFKGALSFDEAQDLIDQLFNSSEKRLARTLLLLARYPPCQHL